MNSRKLLDEPPAESRVTDYDRAHLVTYLRLLDAEADAADWQEAAELILGIDPEREHDRALRIHTSHLARAKWMTANGYRDLLRGRFH